MKRCSSGKKSFKTEKAAWKAVIEFNATGAAVGDVYYHRECRRFHLTSQRDNRPYWVRRAVQKRLRHKETEKIPGEAGADAIARGPACGPSNGGSAAEAELVAAVASAAVIAFPSGTCRKLEEFLWKTRQTGSRLGYQPLSSAPMSF